LIEEIQNQGPNWKRHVNIKVEIDRIRSQIEEIESLLNNWGSKCTNSKPMTKIKKRRPTSGLTIEFDRDAIELIVKIKILIEDWIAQIKHWGLIWKIHFLAPFSFIWNDMFCTKRRCFTCYSIIIKKSCKQCRFNGTVCHHLLPWTRKGRGRKLFFPSFATLVSLSL